MTENQRDEGACAPHVLILMQLRTLACGIMQPAFSVVLSSSVKRLWESPQMHTKRFASWLILNGTNSED